MSSSAALPASFAIPSLRGGALAFIEFAASLLSRDGLTADERRFIERVQQLTGSFGEYVIEAENRTDLLTRVDAVLEDPRFHREYQGLFGMGFLNILPEAIADLAKLEEEELPQGLVEALGPAAVPHLRKLHRHMMALGQLLGPLLASSAHSGADHASSDDSNLDPLAFLSAATIPVPLAAAMLSCHRLNVLILAAGAIRFRPNGGQRWLGLALAELMADNSQQMLALFVAITGAEVPTSLLAPEDRLNMRAIGEHARATQDAYMQFNTAAERSGDPVFPAPT
ncbi:hypothetical protein HJC22_23140 [Corallococcus exiguus]|uniref:hypothetical protein n=1 Tax=Corallococcus exiguus TaxID=83462 RepID=UPI0014709B4D|nr:hypothetical protein [Corallococcus exiguus]NNC18613.1 hypothetical protein [Corallococcus exiguus]